MRHHGVFKKPADQRKDTDGSLQLTKDRRRCAKQSTGTGEGAQLVWRGLGRFPKGEPCTGVVGFSLSDRGGGAGIPSVGMRVTRLLKQKATWRGTRKLGGLELKSKGEAGEEEGYEFRSNVTDKTSKSLPALFPICLVSRCCLLKGKE